MLLLRKKIHDRLANIVRWLDYILYMLLSPFRFKKYPLAIKKILIVELFKIGDLLVATPVIEALKKIYPNAEINFLIPKETAVILQNNPHVNKTIPYTTFSETRSILEQNSYDLGIILHPGSFKISLLLLLANISYRVGCAKSGITYGKGFFLNKKVKPNTAWQHKIEDNLDILRSLPIDQSLISAVERRPKLYLPADVETKMRKFLLGKKRPIVVIHAPSSHKTQRWYPEKFAVVADMLHEERKATIIFTGSESEKPQIEDIIALMKSKEYLDLAGKTSFWEFASLLKNADILISVDTSAMHIASAFNTPVVALFGPTMPQFWGPTSEESRVIQHNNVCTGCRRYKCIIKTHECMRTITPQEVINSVKELIK